MFIPDRGVMCGVCLDVIQAVTEERKQPNPWIEKGRCETPHLSQPLAQINTKPVGRPRLDFLPGR
jgi:hypothetical protein